MSKAHPKMKFKSKADKRDFKQNEAFKQMAQGTSLNQQAIVEITLNYNALHEMSFRMFKKLYDIQDEQEARDKFHEEIKEIRKEIIEDIEKQSQEMWDQKNGLKLVDREVQEGDMIRARIEAKHGEKIIRSVPDYHFLLSDEFKIQPLKEALIGMRAGEIKAISIEFESGFHEPEFAGKKIDFEIEIFGVKELIKGEENGTSKSENAQQQPLSA